MSEMESEGKVMGGLRRSLTGPTLKDHRHIRPMKPVLKLIRLATEAKTTDL